MLQIHLFFFFPFTSFSTPCIIFIFPSLPSLPVHTLPILSLLFLYFFSLKTHSCNYWASFEWHASSFSLSLSLFLSFFYFIFYFSSSTSSSSLIPCFIQVIFSLLPFILCVSFVMTHFHADNLNLKLFFLSFFSSSVKRSSELQKIA